VAISDLMPLTRNACKDAMDRMECSHAKQDERLSHKLKGETDAIWRDLAPIRDSDLANRLTSAEELLQTTRKEFEAWQAGCRQTFVDAVAEVCAEHLTKVDETCQDQGRTVLKHLDKIECYAQEVKRTCDKYLQDIAEYHKQIQNALEQTESHRLATEKAASLLRQQSTIWTRFRQWLWRGC